MCVNHEVSRPHILWVLKKDLIAGTLIQHSVVFCGGLGSKIFNTKGTVIEDSRKFIKQV